MTLYIEKPAGVFDVWRGERIGGLAYPRQIETAFSEEDLNGIGLFSATPADLIADGFRSVSTSVERVEGVVRFVDVVEPIPAPTPAEITASLQPALDAAEEMAEILGIAFDRVATEARLRAIRGL